MASTRYISDQLSLTMRDGPGTQFKITKMVKAGQRVNVLEVDDGWSKVRTAGGTTGFVLTRLLSDHPAAREQVASMKDQVATLKQKNGQLKQDLEAARGNSSTLGEAKKTLTATNSKLKTQLAHIKKISAKAVHIDQENATLHKELAAAQAQVKQLERADKAHSNRRQGMEIGALILIIGIILGLVLPLLKRRKRSGWA